MTNVQFTIVVGIFCDDDDECNVQLHCLAVCHV